MERTLSISSKVTLPPPLSAGQGWPWEAVTPKCPANIPSPPPRISVVTPSFNQGRYLEQTIRSVLLQGYPNLEYVVIDGGSTDESIDILKYYHPWLHHWTSEPDGGQSMAINKGLRQTTGDILAYLNSDDYYLPGALHSVAATFSQNPQADLVHGRCQIVDEGGRITAEQFGSIHSFREIIDLWSVWWQRRQFVQPEVFWTRRIMEKIGFLSEELHYGMDYDYWTRILRQGAQLEALDYPVATFRIHAQQKSCAAEKAAAELLSVARKYLWEKGSPLPWMDRFDLQNHWLYTSVFLRRVSESMARNEKPLVRYRRLSQVLLRYPQIALGRGFRSRLFSMLSGKIQEQPPM
jgi:glycosyltransferase involved in cell wall biosynthesis